MVYLFVLVFRLPTSIFLPASVIFSSTLLLSRASEDSAPILDDRASRAHASLPLGCRQPSIGNRNTSTIGPSIGNSNTSRQHYLAEHRKQKYQHYLAEHRKQKYQQYLAEHRKQKYQHYVAEHRETEIPAGSTSYSISPSIASTTSQLHGCTMIYNRADVAVKDYRDFLHLIIYQLRHHKLVGRCWYAAPID